MSGAIAVTLARPPSRDAALSAPSTTAAPVMSVFIVVMPSKRLEVEPARVEGDPLADEHHVRAASRRASGS